MRKVVVTGMGCVSGLGGDKASTWESLEAGKSAIRATTVFPEGQRELSFSGVAAPAVTDALRNLAARYEEKQLNVDLFSNFAAAATLEALEDAGIWGDEAKLSDAAIIYGSASGGNAAMEAGYLRLFFSRLSNVHPMTIPRLMASAGASHLSMLFGIRGHCLAISSACASSAHAIGEAMHFIRSGRSSIVITGGSDASLTFGALQGWKALQAMAPDMCRPFSIDRKGMVLGEGAATLVLEEEEHALRRGAHIYAEVAGAGSTSDAGHLTQPNAERAAAAIRAAHKDAELDEEAPVLISAHGTGTRLNDRSGSIGIATRLSVQPVEACRHCDQVRPWSYARCNRRNGVPHRDFGADPRARAARSGFSRPRSRMRSAAGFAARAAQLSGSRLGVFRLWRTELRPDRKNPQFWLR